MDWVWTDQDESQDSFYATFDYENSEVESYLLMGPNHLPETSGRIFLLARRYTTKRILRYGCLPAASNDRTIHDRLAPILLSNVGKNEVQLYPVQIRAKDSLVDNFFAVMPRHQLICTDIANSEITSWIAENEVCSGYKSISFLPNCLGELSIARDSVTGLVVVSDKLKLSLEATKEKGLNFVFPKNAPPYFS